MFTQAEAGGYLMRLSAHVANTQSAGQSKRVFFLTSTAALILWMDKILHHFKPMGNHCLLVFPGESSLHSFLGGAKITTS